MARLSAAQIHVLERMRQGWALCTSEGFDSSCWLQRDGCGKGGLSEKVRSDTWFSLFKRKLIHRKEQRYPTSTWELTDG